MEMEDGTNLQNTANNETNLNQNGSYTTAQQTQINEDNHQPTANHAIDFTR